MTKITQKISSDRSPSASAKNSSINLDLKELDNSVMHNSRFNKKSRSSIDVTSHENDQKIEAT